MPAGGTIRLGRLPDASEEDAIGEGGGEGGGRGGEAGGVGEWGPTAEVAAAAEAREAAAYSELLETLKELVDGEAKGPSSPWLRAAGEAAGEGSRATTRRKCPRRRRRFHLREEAARWAARRRWRWPTAAAPPRLICSLRGA